MCFQERTDISNMRKDTTDNSFDASITLVQEYFGPDAYVDLLIANDRTVEHVMIDGTTAILVSGFKSIRGVNASATDFEVLTLHWFRNDVFFGLSLIAPEGVFCIDTLIAVAGSVG